MTLVKLYSFKNSRKKIFVSFLLKLKKIIIITLDFFKTEDVFKANSVKGNLLCVVYLFYKIKLRLFKDFFVYVKII